VPDEPEGRLSRREEVSLRDLMISELRRVDEKFINQNDAVREATRIATAALDKRLEGMNEFRQQINDWSKAFATKADADALNQRLYTVEKLLNNMQGRLWGIAALVVIIEVALQWFHR
jgi:hypothetical protein